MAAGKFNMQANDGAVIGLIVPDGLTSGERQISLGVNLSGIAAYHLLGGNLAVSASTITQGFNTTLYTSGSATTGIDMSTQWGNTVEEKFGGLVWLKDRVEATNNFLYDTVRGATKEINSNTTEAEATLAGGLTSFGSTGFTVGADAGHNSTTNNMTSWNFQTTHRVTGTTNHGKAYTCHFNPFTGFTIVKYEGSGLAGHEIPHNLGRKLGFVTVKSLSNGSTAWQSTYDGINRVFLNLTNAQAVDSYVITLNENSIAFNNSAGTLIDLNASSNNYIMYGWANSYLDESNKLIGNYELVTYQGTGVAGNKVKTKGKPAWVMIKRTDAAANWVIFDNTRGTFKNVLYPNVVTIEGITVGYGLDILSDGFSHTAGTGVADTQWNAAGGQYIALVAYDTNSNGGGSYYPLASDTANVQVNNALIPLAQGIDSNGAKNTILSKNETITGLTYTQGKNYVYCDKNGAYGVSRFAPQYNTYNGFGDYFDTNKNKWFNIEVDGIGANNSSTTSAIPILASDSSYHGVTLSSNTIFSAYQTYKAFNGNIADTEGWVVNNNNVFPVSMGYRFTNIEVINKVLIWNRAEPTPRAIGTFKIQGSLDGTTWVDLSGIFTNTNNTSGFAHPEYVFTNITPYYYYRVYILSGLDATYTGIGEVRFISAKRNIGSAITNSRNYLNHIVYADNDGGVLYVEELPKIEYKDNNLKVNTLYADKLVVAGIDARSWETAELTNTGAKFKDGTLKFRVPNVRYYNTKEYEIIACVTISEVAGGNIGAWYGVVDGITVSIYQFYVGTTASGAGTLWLPIPPGSSYYFTGCASWVELR